MPDQERNVRGVVGFPCTRADARCQTLHREQVFRGGHGQAQMIELGQATGNNFVPG